MESIGKGILSVKNGKCRVKGLVLGAEPDPHTKLSYFQAENMLTCSMKSSVLKTVACYFSAVFSRYSSRKTFFVVHRVVVSCKSIALYFCTCNVSSSVISSPDNT